MHIIAYTYRCLRSSSKIETVAVSIVSIIGSCETALTSKHSSRSNSESLVIAISTHNRDPGPPCDVPGTNMIEALKEV